MKTEMERFFSALVLLPTGTQYSNFIKDTIQNNPEYLGIPAKSIWCAKCGR